jgi:hypothetical protein
MSTLEAFTSLFFGLGAIVLAIVLAAAISNWRGRA